MNIKLKTELRKRLLGAGIAALIGCSALAPNASAEPARRSVTVQYGDLNLANQVGVERLYQRLRHAAEQVCGGRRAIGPLVLGRSYRECTKQAVAEAVRSIDNRTLTALHQEKTTGRAS